MNEAADSFASDRTHSITGIELAIDGGLNAIVPHPSQRRDEHAGRGSIFHV